MWQARKKKAHRKHITMRTRAARWLRVVHRTRTWRRLCAAAGRALRRPVKEQNTRERLRLIDLCLVTRAVSAQGAFGIRQNVLTRMDASLQPCTAAGAYFPSRISISVSRPEIVNCARLRRYQRLTLEHRVVKNDLRRESP